MWQLIFRIQQNWRAGCVCSYHWFRSFCSVRISLFQSVNRSHLCLPCRCKPNEAQVKTMFWVMLNCHECGELWMCQCGFGSVWGSGWFCSVHRGEAPHTLQHWVLLSRVRTACLCLQEPAHAALLVWLSLSLENAPFVFTLQMCAY